MTSGDKATVWQAWQAEQDWQGASATSVAGTCVPWPAQSDAAAAAAGGCTLDLWSKATRALAECALEAIFSVAIWVWAGAPDAISVAITSPTQARKGSRAIMSATIIWRMQ